MLVKEVVIRLTILEIYIVKLSIKKTIGLDILSIIFIFLVKYGRNQLILNFLAFWRQAQLFIKKIGLSIYIAL